MRYIKSSKQAEGPPLGIDERAVMAKLQTEWVVENLNDEGFLCGGTFTTRAEAVKYAKECEDEGLTVLTIHEQVA